MNEYENMNPRLKHFIDAVESKKALSEKEWLALEADLKECLKTVSDEEELEFAESGYGETISMICDGIRLGK